MSGVHSLPPVLDTRGTFSKHTQEFLFSLLWSSLSAFEGSAVGSCPTVVSSHPRTSPFLHIALLEPGFLQFTVFWKGRGGCQAVQPESQGLTLDGAVHNGCDSGPDSLDPGPACLLTALGSPPAHISACSQGESAPTSELGVEPLGQSIRTTPGA